VDAPDSVTVGAIALGAITLGSTLAKVIEKMIDKFMPSKKDDAARTHLESGDRVEKKIDALVEWHNAKDVNGLPLGYFPRSMIEDQKRIAEILQEISEQMERVADKLDNHDERTERGFTEVRRDVGRLGK
jgi:CRISPR/Cas system CSM-associated protein Csm2 small subunit